MLRRLLDTTALTGGQWGIVLALTLIAPAIVGMEKVIQTSRQRKFDAGTPDALEPGRRPVATGRAT